MANNHDLLSDLQKRHHDGQLKYVYFLLAASGACIAFSLNKAQGTPISCSLAILLLGEIFWAISFVFGCLLLETIQFLMLKDATLVQLALGVHHLQPKTQEQMNFAVNDTDKLIKKNMEKALWFKMLQFYLFVAGGICFIIWSGFEIVRVAPFHKNPSSSISTHPVTSTPVGMCLK